MKCENCTCEEEEEEEENIEKKIEKVIEKKQDKDIEEEVDEEEAEDSVEEHSIIIKENEKPSKKYEDPLGEDYHTELKNKFGRKFFCKPNWDKQHLNPGDKSV